MTGKARSLKVFAEERGAQHGRGAWMETALPPKVLEECIAGWKSGLGITVIHEWLQEQGYPATKGRVAHYLATVSRSSK